MTIEYGSFFYFFYPGLALALFAGLVFLLRSWTERAKTAAILAIAAVNLLQHLLKQQIYPHMWGGSFSSVNTAYNICAFLIIASPFLLLCKSRAIRDFICVTGTIAGFFTMIFPIWFIGKPAFSWEILRFYLCHGLLFLSSALPLALKIHTVSWHNWYKYLPLFLLMLALILVNNLLCIFMGLAGGSPENLYDALGQMNPFLIMGPREDFLWLAELLAPITPDFLVQNGYYVPILWHMVPLYIPLSLVVFVLFALLDRKRFCADWKGYFTILKKGAKL